MKKICGLTLSIILYILLLFWLPMAVSAQNIKLQDVKFIQLKHTIFTRTDVPSETYEVTRNGRYWKDTRFAHQHKDFLPDTSKDTLDTKFSTQIDSNTVAGLINAINNPVTEFEPQSFGITAAYLKANSDSLFKKTLRVLEPDEATAFRNYITDDVIKKVCDPTLFFMNLANDYGEDWEIIVVDNNQRNIRLRSDTFYNFILPWTIANKEPYYNIAIAIFCSNVRGKKTLINGPFIHLTYAAGACYERLYNHYCQEYFRAGDFVATFGSPNYYTLSVYFDITKLHSNDKQNVSDPILSIQLHDKDHPKNITFFTSFHLNDDIAQRIIDYCVNVETVFKKNEFLFEFISRSPAYQLTFDAIDTIKDYKAVQERHYYLKTFAESQVKQFHIENKSTGESSTWYLLPKGQMFLLSLTGPGLLNLSPKDIGMTKFPSKLEELGVVFDQNGSVLNKISK